MNYKKPRKQYNIDITNVYTVVTASEDLISKYGYLSNSYSELKKAVEFGRTNMRTYYSKIDNILPETSEKRYVTKDGIFSLFYPLDTEENEERY